MGKGHDHGHAAGRAGDRARLRLVLAITGVVLVVELAGAWVAGSLALLADAGHMATADRLCECTATCSTSGTRRSRWSRSVIGSTRTWARRTDGLGADPCDSAGPTEPAAQASTSEDFRRQPPEILR